MISPEAERPVTLFIASSLDGYIARADGGIDWLFSDEDYGYKEFLRSVDTVVMGRKTYEQALSFGGEPFPGKSGYVFSRSRQGEKDRHVRFIGEDIGEFMRALRCQAGGGIWLVGGAQVIRVFLVERLIDRIVLSIHPILLGAGIPLFMQPYPETPLVVRGSCSYDSGLVQIRYDIHR